MRLDSGALMDSKLHIERVQSFSLRLSDKKPENSILLTFYVVSSVLGPKPPLFGAVGSDQSPIYIPILRGPTANIQDLYLESCKSFFLHILRN